MSWLQTLSPRDRAALLGGGAVLALVLFYVAAWEPLATRRAELAERVTQQRAQLAWMQAAAAEARTLLARGGPQQAAGGSLLSLIDRTAGEAGLGGAVRRLAPEGDDGVRVWLGEAPYPALLRWLETLQRQGIALQTLQAERHETPGRVEARVLVGRAG